MKIGSQVKQIVSGIKGHYTAEEMVGKKVMVLVNLKPAKLAGVLSEGMLLCAEDAEGNLALMTPEKQCRQARKFVKISSRKSQKGTGQNSIGDVVKLNFTTSPKLKGEQKNE